MRNLLLENSSSIIHKIQVCLPNIYADYKLVVVVGQIIGDGIGFDLDVEGNVTGFLVCVEFPKFDEWQLRLEPAYKTIVVSDIELKTFSTLDLNLSLKATEYCLELSGDSVFFPAMYVSSSGLL